MAGFLAPRFTAFFWAADFLPPAGLALGFCLTGFAVALLLAACLAAFFSDFFVVGFGAVFWVAFLAAFLTAGFPRRRLR